MKPRFLSLFALLAAVVSFPVGHVESGEYRISTFTADVTIPLDHRCMGVLPTKSKVIVDPLEAIGFVILGADQPLVYVAVDWCEIRNGAYDQWRDGLATAAGTTRERVLVSSLHQHDAPVTDSGAAELLNAIGLSNELYDEAFHAKTIQRVATALKASLSNTVPLTHIGTGKARVEKIASNRRVVLADGRVAFARGSSSGGHAYYSQAPDGEIDPDLKTLSFWNEEEPVVAVHAYATHPMSYYGRGGVSADFVGLARRKMQQNYPELKQIYASGCSGDVTAGKFNDGSEESRKQLTQRLYEGMKQAWANTEKTPVEQITFRKTEVELKFYDHPGLKPQRLETILNDDEARTEDRILAAMGLSSYHRVESGQLIDFPCLDFGTAQLVLFPGESFVGYQLMAQAMKPDSFVVSIGYGECWPGYIPTNAAFADGFHDKWLWVGPGSENQVRQGLQKLLMSKEAPARAD